MPVFLSDNHAGSYRWIATRLDLDTPHTLVLIDAHSDASAAERSEAMREQVRRVPSMQARVERIEDWRSQGRLQAYNWIEPLMPRPLEQVLWLPEVTLAPEEKNRLRHEAVAALDGRLEVEPRAAGSFDHRWQVVDLAGLLSWSPEGKDIILGLDLDFFAGMDDETRESLFQTLWSQAMTWPGLKGVAVAVSRPWLDHDEEADALVSLLLDAVARTPAARLEIDARVDDGPDFSQRAQELAPAPVPRWDLARSSERVKHQLLALEKRCHGQDPIHDPTRDLEPLLEAWRDGLDPVRLQAQQGQIDVDRVWRHAVGDEPVLRLSAPDGATGRVRWYRLLPAHPACDLLPGTGLGKGFADRPARWVHEIREYLGESGDFLLAPSRWATGGPGRHRFVAECETAQGWLVSPVVELRLSVGEGFRAALSECFGMPYVFGIALVSEGDLSGVETGWGSDCSNFLIHAWRRQGRPMAWGDPGILRRQLRTKAENLTLADRVPLTGEEIAAGVAIDFNRHVAALWEDLPPTGSLGPEDLVVHHLGGFPEIVTLAALAESREPYAVRIPPDSSGVRVTLAGDVVLAGEDLQDLHVLPGFGRGDSDLFLVNLEGIPTDRPGRAGLKYDFRFPRERLAWLKEQGVDAVSLANNHALDAGEGGLVQGLDALQEAGIAVVGAGRNIAEACRPWQSDRGGTNVAVFGVSLLSGWEAGEEQPGVATLPAHAPILEREMARASARGERIIVLVHGGDEYREQVSEDQRHWARWLVARGAVHIAGSHPHVVQREEQHGGARIVHSLGNAVYPKALKGADSGKILVVELL